MTDIRLEDIFKDISVHTDFQHELMDSDDTNPTSEINAVYEELTTVKGKRYAGR